MDNTKTPCLALFAGRGLPVDAVRCFWCAGQPYDHDGGIMGARNITMAYFAEELEAANDH